MKIYWQLFSAFFRIGLFTFGGGYAMLPMLQKEIVEKYKWATNDEILNYFAIGQCTPGVIAVNTATFIGYKKRGVRGAALATFAIVLPSLIIISVIAAFLKNFAEFEAVKKAFVGIRVAVAVLVASAVIKLWKSGIKDRFGIAIFIVALAVQLMFNLSPIIVIVAAIVLGILKKGGEQNDVA